MKSKTKSYVNSFLRVVEMSKIEQTKIEDGAFFIVDTTSFFANLTPYDELLANQTIDYRWTEPSPVVPIKQDLLKNNDLSP